jgi:hypothetical protein
MLASSSVFNPFNHWGSLRYRGPLTASLVSQPLISLSASYPFKTRYVQLRTRTHKIGVPHRRIPAESPEGLAPTRSCAQY